jgi:tRNA(Arg) A34 adenosine deaminase TadA
MHRAIESARRGMAAGEPPIGACVVRDGKPIATAHNSVVSELDVTAHAEIIAIRKACKSLGLIDLSGCHLYVTVEPCAMCIAACHYAGISLIVFGARLSDIDAITGNELIAPYAEMFAEGSDAATMVGDFLRNDCLELLREWGSPKLGVSNR